MVPIIGKRAQFIAIVLARDCQNWHRDPFKLITRRQHRVVVHVGHWVLENTLKINRWISHK